jgi:hypothetical protein
MEAKVSKIEVGKPPPTAASLIAELDEGQIDGQATDLLRQVVEAVEATGKEGKLTITIKVRKEGKIAAVGGEVKAQVPQPSTREMLYHFTPEGRLSRDDPRQVPLHFKPVITGDRD